MTDIAPRIGITTYAVNSSGDIPLPHQYVSSVRRAGGIPLLIAPGEPRVDRCSIRWTASSWRVAATFARHDTVDTRTKQSIWSAPNATSRNCSWSLNCSTDACRHWPSVGGCRS